MKKKLLTFLCLMATVVLAACGFKKVDAGNYLKTSFSGVDTKGRITYQFNTEELITTFLVENPKADAKTESELKAAVAEVKISPSKTENLSNDEEVTLTFANTKNLEKFVTIPSEKKVKVTGLTAVKKLNSEELAKLVTLEATGFNKKGKAKVRVNDPRVASLRFVVENDGQLENGKDAKIKIDGNFDRVLESNGYILEGDGSFTLPVKGLKTVADKFEDAKNKDEVVKKLKEEINKKYTDATVTFDKTYYRGLSSGVGESGYGDGLIEGNGNLVMLVRVEYKYAGKRTLAIGLSNLVTNAEGNIELKDAQLVDKYFEDFATATQKLEAIGYTEVK